MRRVILFGAMLAVLLSVTACGFSAKPTVVDYSEIKDLSQSQVEEIMTQWEASNTGYELRGDIAYYGAFNGYLVLQAPITEGGIAQGEYGYRRFESDGPLEIFFYGDDSSGTKRFITLSDAKDAGLIDNLDAIHRQHFVYCEQVLGYVYTFDPLTPPEDVKKAVEMMFSHDAYMELSWSFTSGISYYGQYNGYHVAFVENEELMSFDDDDPEWFGTFRFDEGVKYDMRVFYQKEGSTEVQTQSFDEAFYNKGYIAPKDMESIYSIYQKYELDSFRKQVEPDTVSTELPTIIDFSEDSDLTQDKLEKLQKEWVKWIARDDIDYELRGDLVYLGTFDNYAIIHAPITKGSIRDWGYRQFESDGPVEFFAYGSFGDSPETFHRIMKIILHTGFSGDNYAKVVRRNQIYCEEAFGYVYTTEMLLPDESVRGDIMAAANAASGQAAKEWDFRKGMLYFGEYNGYHIVFVRIVPADEFAWTDEFAGFYFNGSANYVEIGYKDGEVHLLGDLCQRGEIVLEDIERMYKQFQKYQLDADRRAEIN